ncbi:MAG: hypothetical protein Q9166_003588 [cf. Caloplaca sp. 2 TL-2023]
MESTNSPTEGLPVYYVGQHESKRQLPISPQTLRQAQACNYDMLTTPITTPLFHSRVLALLSNHFSDLKDGCSDDNTIPSVSKLSSTDTPLTPSETISQLVGIASPWIDLSSPDPVVYNISRQVLELEISYAAFCGLGNVVVPGPKLQYGVAHGEGVSQYAYAIQEALALTNYTQILIHLPMMYHPDQDGEDVEGSLSPFTRPQYVEERGRSKHDFLALSIPRHLPAIHAQSRWHSEPLRLLSLTAQTFLPDPQGDPVLTKVHKALIHHYMRLRTPPWILLCDVGPIPGLSNPEAKIPHADGFISVNAASDPEILPTPTEASRLSQTHDQNRTSNLAVKKKGPTPHLSYIRELQCKSPTPSILETFGSSYQDYLQGPLQPLSDNLESMTYEVFEKDPVKYDLYESAIRRALTDWRSLGKTGSGPSREQTIVVAVVGAGRGPLVTRALRAAEDAGVKIEMWAVEKNPNAFVLLQRHNELEWSGQVHLVQSDMRSWGGPSSTQSQQHSSSYQIYQQHQPPSREIHHKIDILISELLGSFADNELSPECLDGMTPLLNPIHGMSIPASYTSYLTPIAAPKLHADIASRTPNDPTAPNTPYVVMLHAIDYLSTSPPSPDFPSTAPEPIVQAAWSFSHKPTNNPKCTLTKVNGYTTGSNDNKHNTRSTRLHFPTPHRGCIHGLAGYFSAVLYADIELSTHPLTMAQKSPDMMSWFPIYFPLKVKFPPPLPSLFFFAFTPAIGKASSF